MANTRSAYEALIEAGQIEADPAQAEIVGLLDDLETRLKTRGKKSFFSKPKPVKGLYLWGGVGRGKSMLMDLFFAGIDLERKRRVHFHDFMQDTHSFINAWKKLSEKERRKSDYAVRGSDDDPIPPAAKKIASEAELLCFDEFQVSDIADAMLLGRLFEHVLERGVVVVATSNREPDGLYKNGLNRQRFLPFIALMKETHNVHEIKSVRDYRLERLTAAPVYYSPRGGAASQAMDEAWARLTELSEVTETKLIVHGREVVLPKSTSDTVRCSFDALCNQPLGAADYLSIASHFRTVMIDDVPVLSPRNGNAAKRFVTLIDALYEARTKLIMSADAEPNALYVSGEGAFEFERTASRLYEMRSADYLAAEHEVIAEDALTPSV